MKHNVKNKSSMENKIQIENILLRFALKQKTLDESTKEVCDLFHVINCECETNNYDKHVSAGGIVIYKCKDCGGCL